MEGQMACVPSRESVSGVYDIDDFGGPEDLQDLQDLRSLYRDS